MQKAGNILYPLAFRAAIACILLLPWAAIASGAGGALNFDGDDRILVPHDNSLNSASLTYEAWIKPSDINGDRSIVSKGTGLGGSDSLFQILNGRMRYFSNSFPWHEANSVMSANEWHHVAVTRAVDGTVTFYLDGQPDGSVPGTSEPTPGNNDFFIGLQGSICRCNGFRGAIDEVRVWNVARTPEQIVASLGRSLTGFEDGLVSYWRFDEGEVQIAADTSGSNDGTLGDDNAVAGDDPLRIASGAPVNSTGIVLNFDGDDRILVPHDNSLNSASLTYEAWIKPSDINGDRSIVSKGTGLGGSDSLFQILNGRMRYFSNSFPWHEANSVMSANEWHHVAVTRAVDGTVTFYLDGQPDGSVPGTSEPTPGNNDFFIGLQGSICRCNGFRGAIDEVRVWNVARSAGDIRDNRFFSIDSSEPGLVAYWRLDEAAGQLARDSTGANDGSLGDDFSPAADDPAWSESKFIMSQACGSDSVTLVSQADVDSFQVVEGPCTGLRSQFTVQGADITDLRPLGVLTAIGGNLFVQNNPFLYRLNALDNLTFVGGQLQVSQNPSLWQCGAIANLIDGFDEGAVGPAVSGQAPDVGSTVFVSGNLAGCSTVVDVLSGQPGVPALTFHGGSPIAVAGQITIGWSFNVNNPILISHLGAFDSVSADPLETPHPVGLWAPDGTLLVKTVVSTTSPQVDGFRFAEIPALALLAGDDYRIGVVYDTSTIPADFPTIQATQMTQPDITFRTAMQAGIAGLNRPTIENNDFNDGFFGANFIVAGRQQAALQVSGATAIGSVGDITLGWEFSVSEPLIVAQVGLYDPNPAEPLEESHQVGIWSASGTLLASTVVAADSPLQGQLRVTGISPIVLQPGAGYTIGAVYNTENSPSDPPYAFATNSSIPQVQYQRSVQSGGGFARPELALNFEDGVFGPVFITTNRTGLVELSIFSDSFESKEMP